MMEGRKTVFVLCILLLSLPQNVAAGPISYVSCMAAVGGGAVVGGAAVLPLLGFTSSGIAAGSWAASMMAAYGGAIPAGSLLATLQSAGAAGVSWSSLGGISGLCAALTAPLP